MDRLEDFTLPHLPNAYLGRVGIPAEEFDWQIEALRSISAGNLPDTELFDPETLLPRGAGSKILHEQSDKQLEALIGKGSKKILVWGAGDGALEKSIADCGHTVDVVPLNSVLGYCCARRGLTVISNEQLSRQPSGEYNSVIAVDAIHKRADAEQVLAELRGHLAEGGKLIARVPNLNRIGLMRYRFGDVRKFGRWNSAEIGADALTGRQLEELAQRAGLRHCLIHYNVPEKWERRRGSLRVADPFIATYIYLVGDR